MSEPKSYYRSPRERIRDLEAERDEARVDAREYRLDGNRAWAKVNDLEAENRKLREGIRKHEAATWRRSTADRELYDALDNSAEGENQELRCINCGALGSETKDAYCPGSLAGHKWLDNSAEGERCERCRGTGQLPVEPSTRSCSTCGGTGIDTR